MDNLRIGGVSCRELADRFGTPLYIYDESKIIKQAEDAVSSFSSDKFATEVVYASKAFSCKRLFRLLAGKGIGLDVVSGGELYGAVQSGMDMSKVYFHGNNKSDREITEALEAGTGYFVVDNMLEAGRLASLAEERGIKTKALLRINPGISAHTHEYIMTSKPDSKFGIYIDNRDQIYSVMDRFASCGFVELAGFHSHIGSQIVESGSFEKALGTMIGFLADIRRTRGIDGLELSIGGGFGIRYLPGDSPVSLGDMCANLISYAEAALEKNDVHISKLITEPGRSMVGEAGDTLYTAGDMKKSGDKNYLFVDGGMSDNIRPALYDAEYTAVLPEKYTEPPVKKYCIAGKNCESGDVLISGIMLPEAQPKDLVLIRCTGAYGYSMASNYNRLGRPAVVFARDGKAELVIKRETYEDQYRMEV